MSAAAPSELRGLLRGPAAMTVLVIFLVTAGFALLIGNVEVPWVSVAISVEADEVRLSPARAWELTDLETTSLRITGDGSIALPGIGGQDGRASPELVIEPHGGDGERSATFVSDYLALNARIARDSDVRLSYSEPSGLKIEVVGEAAAAGTVDIGDRLTVGCATDCTIRDGSGEKMLKAQSTVVLTPSMRELRFHADHRLVMAVAFEAEPAELSAGDDLHLSSIDFRRSGGATRASAISGESSVVFPTLSKGDIVLAPGDALHVVPEGVLAVRRMHVGRGIHVELLGKVRELATGPPTALRSRMPTLLEYVQTSRKLQLILGAVSAVAGLLVGVLQKLGFFAKR